MWNWTRPRRTPREPAAGTTVEPVAAEDVAAEYEQLAAEADAIAEVDDTHVRQARTNPLVARHAIASSAALHRRLIDLEDDRARLAADREHARLVEEIEAEQRWAAAAVARDTRAITEAQHDADEAAADLAMIRSYDREVSPVTSSRRLAAAVTRWRVADVGYALAGSALSAVGVSAGLLVATPLPLAGAALVAAVVESVLTVRVVDLLGRLSRLDGQNKSGQTVGEDNSRTHLIVQVVALLAISVLLNVAGLALGAGWLAVVGIAGALLAAMAGLGSHASSRAAADVMYRNLRAWRGNDWEQRRSDLRDRAAGVHIPTRGAPATPQEETRDDEAGVPAPAELEAAVDGIVEALLDRLDRERERQGRPAAWTPHALTGLDEIELRAVLGQALDEDVVRSTVWDLLSQRLAEDAGAHADRDTVEAVAEQLHEDLTRPAPGGGTAVLDEPADGMSGTSRVHPPAEEPTGGEVNAGATSDDGDPLAAHRARQVARSRHRIAEAIAALEAEGAEVTLSAVRRRTGMHLQTVKRHWRAVTGRPLPEHPTGGES